MAKQEAVKRQLIIIKLLRKNGISFKEIEKHLLNQSQETGFNLEISQRTFQRDREEILNLWGIEILFNKRDGIYEITHEDDDSLNERLIESFEMIAVLKKSRNASKYIHLEKRKSNGVAYFNDLIHAIENELKIQFVLNSYWNDPSVRNCVPKGIKETHNRYYLIAWDMDKNEIRNYGLDRISDFLITKEKVKTPSIDIEKLYENAFGIECYGEAQQIILRFDISQKVYLESLPLHHTQKIHFVNDEQIDVKLFVHATNELMMEIMKYGSICEVIKPQILRDKVKQKVRELYKKYN